jgi:hypothetical protein
MFIINRKVNITWSWAESAAEEIINLQEQFQGPLIEDGEVIDEERNWIIDWYETFNNKEGECRITKMETNIFTLMEIMAELKPLILEIIELKSLTLNIAEYYNTFAESAQKAEVEIIDALNNIIDIQKEHNNNCMMHYNMDKHAKQLLVKYIGFSLVLSLEEEKVKEGVITIEQMKLLRVSIEQYLGHINQEMVTNSMKNNPIDRLIEDIGRKVMGDPEKFFEFLGDVLCPNKEETKEETPEPEQGQPITPEEPVTKGKKDNRKKK